MLHKSKKALKLSRLCLELLTKRLENRQLFFLISTPCYGNVGDHAIELAQQEILRDCGIWERTIEITSIEYGYLSGFIKKLVRPNDVIILDGGGNFGDTWPETMNRINEIIANFSRNRIFIFPESWYYSDTEVGRRLLQETLQSFGDNTRIIIYARDSWSYCQMKQQLPGINVKYAFDTVFYKRVMRDDIQIGKGIVGVSMRDDKEKKNAISENQVLQILKKYGYDPILIHNDNYGHVEKKERETYFRTIIEQYGKCQTIITDRFHGFVFSLIKGKPCIIIDNLTGKILHFYNDISDDVDGVMPVIEGKIDEEDIKSFLLRTKLSYKPSYDSKISKYRKEISNDLIKWRE